MRRGDACVAPTACLRAGLIVCVTMNHRILAGPHPRLRRAEGFAAVSAAYVEACESRTRSSARPGSRIRSEAEDAKRDPDASQMFRALRLNQGTSDVIRSVPIDADSWARAERDDPPDMAGRYALGLDLGQNAAMSAAAAYFWNSGRLEAFAVFPEIPGLAERGIGDGVAGRTAGERSRRRRRGLYLGGGGRRSACETARPSRLAVRGGGVGVGGVRYRRNFFCAGYDQYASIRFHLRPEARHESEIESSRHLFPRVGVGPRYCSNLELHTARAARILQRATSRRLPTRGRCSTPWHRHVQEGNVARWHAEIVPSHRLTSNRHRQPFAPQEPLQLRSRSPRMRVRCHPRRNLQHTRTCILVPRIELFRWRRNLPPTGKRLRLRRCGTR